MTRTIGYILVVLGIGICLLAGLFLGLGVSSDQLKAPGAVLGFGLVGVFVVAPLVAGGVISLRKAASDQASQVESGDLRKVLDAVQARGQVRISDLAIELKRDSSQVRDLIYQLVGLGVFSGYINWADGVLYSSAASSLRDLGECKHCGGKLSLVGKGVVKCPYCETEYFLTT